MSQSKESNETNNNASAKTFPRPMNHVGISVTDIDAAMTWYHDVLGFTVLSTPADIIVNDSTHTGFTLGKVFGPGLKHVKMAHMSAANGVGLEFFQFVDPPTQRPHATEGTNQKFEYARAGFFHICVTDPNPEDLARRIAETGGQQISPVLNVFPDEIYRIVYCLDPNGNVVEVISASYESVMSNRDPKATSITPSPAETT